MKRKSTPQIHFQKFNNLDAIYKLYKIISKKEVLSKYWWIAISYSSAIRNEYERHEEAVYKRIPNNLYTYITLQN